MEISPLKRKRSRNTLRVIERNHIKNGTTEWLIYLVEG